MATRTSLAWTLDILDAIGAIRTFTQAATRETFVADRMLRDAVARNLEIISEASRHLDEEATRRHPEVPWRRVADLGNKLRHEYFRSDWDLLWGIVAKDLEPLQLAISAIRSRLLAGGGPPPKE